MINKEAIQMIVIQVALVIKYFDDMRQYKW